MEIVWRDAPGSLVNRSSVPTGPRYPPHMGTLRIEVGDLHFSARWEAAAPKTIEAIRRMLPIDSKLIHCRWTGESTWIPFGDFRPGLDYENHTSHPAPGHLAIYPGGISETEILLAYGGVCFASKMGQLAGNHFLTITEGRNRQVRRMVEAVGQEYWDDYLAAISRALRPSGRAALQLISIDHALFDGYAALHDDGYLIVRQMTGTAHSLSGFPWNYAFIQTTNESPVTITIPSNATEAIPIGANYRIEQNGAGAITVAGARGVTVQGTRTTGAQYQVLLLVKTAANRWVVSRQG